MTETQFSADEIGYMRRALLLAELGLNTTAPNPRVGCVLVNDGAVVGEGWHERAGEAHAEARALAVAGRNARGATAYVTLEPCAAQGRTPPCVDGLLAAGVRRVIYAAADPSARMRGGGARLSAAGLEVRGGLLEAEARAQNHGFFKRHEQGLPWVRVKLAASVDGRTALANGVSRWITGDAARKDAQHGRARSSVVLTGVGTILADDPALNVRLAGATRQPVRVVLDTRWRTPPSARVLLREDAALIFGAEPADAASSSRRESLRATGARTEAVATTGVTLSLPAVMRRLAELEANEVWVESGPTLAGALLAAGLVDELVLYLAPCLLGDDARPLVRLPALTALEQRHTLRYVECVPVGDDLRLIARVAAKL